MGTLTSGPVKDVYQKLVWYNTSTKKLMYTDGADADAEVDDAKISGDLTVTGGKITFGNGEVVHNEADGAVTISSPQLSLASTSGAGIFAVLAAAGNDSKIALYDSSSIRWSMGQDQNDSANLKFDYANATVGGATKLTLDGSGNLTASNSLVVGNATLTTSELDCSSGNFTIDGAAAINLDSHTGFINFQKAGTVVGGIGPFLSGEYEFYLVSDSNILDKMYIRVYDNGATSIITTDADAALAHLTFDADGDIILDAESGITKFYKAGDNDDLCTLTVAANGATTLATSDSDGAAGHLTLDPDGDLIISGADTKIDAAKKLYLDGGTHTYIEESSDDVVQVYAGGDKIVELTEATTGNVADFGTTGVGFTQFEPTYNASDTNVNFNDNGNKAFITFGAGNITDMNLYFPNVSCNCVLLLKQDGSGSRTVTNWKTFDQADGNESTVVWAGGSAPTLTTTASKLDILSFYWDNDNHKAYGVATLNF